MDIELAKQYGALIAEKRELEETLRTCKERIAQLEPLVLDEMRANQMEKLHLDGQVLYMHRILVTKPVKDRDHVTEALRADRLDDLLSTNYNANRLSSWVRETLAAGEQLPDALSKAVQVEEIVSIRGRRAAASVESQSASALNTLKEKS
jgi:hypothetical protein